MPVDAFDHFTIRCNDLPASWRFYADVLGLRVTERAGISTPAAIVYLGDMQLIHLFQADADQQAAFARLVPPHAEWGTGRLHHVALQASGLAALRARLSEAAMPFVERTLERLGKHLVLVKDPDQVEIELAFRLDELSAT